MKNSTWGEDDWAARPQFSAVSDINLSVLPSSNGVLWYYWVGPTQAHTHYAVEPAQTSVLIHQSDLKENFNEIFYSRLFSVSFMAKILPDISLYFKWYHLHLKRSSSNMKWNVFFHDNTFIVVTMLAVTGTDSKQTQTCHRRNLSQGPGTFWGTEVIWN